MIRKIHFENYNAIGYRKMGIILRNNGCFLNHKTVLKLMNLMNIHGKVRKSKYKSYKGTIGKIVPNIVERDFVANKPYKKLTTDVTEFPNIRYV